MNNAFDLHERLNQLGGELSSRPSLVTDVMAKLPPVSMPRRPRPLRILQPRTFAALAVAATILIAATLWFSRPSTLYARALEALEKARTVHVTGWTTRIVRKWPLEKPPQADTTDKHPLDAWYWREQDGTPRSYENFGSVVQLRSGDTLREYQQDADLLFIAKGMRKDHLEHFSTVAEYLRALEGSDVVKQELGARVENGKKLRGLRVTRHNRVEEYWFDAETNLPVRLSRSQKEEKAAIGFEMRFAYDKPVPAAVTEYSPPKAKHVRYGGRHENAQLAWRQHVQEIGLRLQEQPLGQAAAILPRAERITFANQWPLMTPDGKHWVVPLDLDQYFPLTLKNFINLRVATEDGERAFETWRIPDDLLELEFPRADLVYSEGTPWQEWVQTVLNQNGLEYSDLVEQRTFWVARQNGQKLKSWHMVKPPVDYIVEAGVEKKGLVKPGVGHQLAPETMHGLFEDFNRLQNLNFTADHPIIIDETGLARAPKWDRDTYPTEEEYRKQVLEQHFVATDSPWFAGQQSRQMARDWFKNELGVTFTEEQRPVTIHVVRRKG